MRLIRLLIVALLASYAVPAYAQQWDQVNGSMQVKSGPSAPLVIIDQTASSQKIISLRANGTEKCSIDTDGDLVCAGTFTLTGQFLAGDGTAAAPSYSFASTGNGDNGMFLSAANVLGWSAAGTERMTLSASALTSTVSGVFPNGTVSAPGLVIGQDDNGFYRTAAAEIGGTISNAKVFSFGLSGGANGYIEILENAAAIYLNDVSLTRTAANLATLGAGDGIGMTTAAWISTAPSGPVACTSPTVTWSNGSAAFQIDVGGTCGVITTLVVTLPAVTNAYSCSAINVGASATAAVEMTASDTTSATFTNYTRTTGVALAWVDGADVRISCTGG